MKKDTICILPFIHFYAQPDGEVRACCISDKFKEPQSLQKNTISDIFNSKPYRELRKDMISGKRNEVCDVCYRKEDRGELSPRQNFNANTLWKMPKVERNGRVEVEFQHVDIRFSNLCNFKCRMCNHLFSSNWFEDSKKIKINGLFPFTQNKNTKVFKASENIVNEIIPYLKNIKSFYFAGGEPLITQEHYKLLKWLYENVEEIETKLGPKKALSIHYSTNLSLIKYNEDELINYWKSFRKVQLAISCDGVYEIGEYQRIGFSHQNFIKNMNQLIIHATESTTEENESITYSFQYTTTIFNIEHIFDFIDFMVDRGYVKNINCINFFYAWSPKYLSVNNLCDEDKLRINRLYRRQMKKLKDDKVKEQLYSLINYMNTPQNCKLNEVKSIVEQMDKLNGTNYKLISNINLG